MKTVTLDFKNVTLRYELHLLLRDKLGFPEYYGMNLDALHDCLSYIAEPTEIKLMNSDDLIENLGRYGEIALHVLRTAAAENPKLMLIF